MAAFIFTPAFATEIFQGGSGGYGAKINDLGGATVNQNTGTNAQIGVTGNGNVVRWDYLNVGAGKRLDFNFTQNGQVVVNKVTGGVSKFAGTVSTSGESGHLIISNPNGMIFNNGAVIQVDTGSATLTTHDVNWDGQKNGRITTTNTNNNGRITISNGMAPVFRVNNDLNIIAPNIDVMGADIFAGGKVRMVSADGVNFAAGASAREDFEHTNFSNNGQIIVADANVEATNSAVVGGQLYLYANTVNMNRANVSSADINVNNNSNINDLTAKHNIKINANDGLNINNAKAGNNVDINVKNNISNINGLTAGNNMTITANGNATANNLTAGNVLMMQNIKNLNGSNHITAPKFIAESMENITIHGLKSDEVHFSNHNYKNGQGGYDLKNVNIGNVSAYTEGKTIHDVKLNQPNKSLKVMEYIDGLEVDTNKRRIVFTKGKNTGSGGTNIPDDEKPPIVPPGDDEGGTIPPIVPPGDDGGTTPPVVPPGDDDGGTTPPTVPPGEDGINATDDDTAANLDGQDATSGEWKDDEVDEDIDTRFRPRYNPRSFAASDNEIKRIKRDVSQNTSVQNGKLKIQKEFKVH